MSPLEQLQSLRIAVVYDRINTRHGGAEYVLEVLHDMFPDAPLYTSVYSPKEARWARGWDVRSSFLQHMPFARSHHRWFVGLMPYAFEQFDFSQYDLVLTITSAEAKGIITTPHTLHVCYLLTPTRYLWSHHTDYAHGLLKPLQQFIFSRLRIWDFHAGLRPDHYIAISQLVKQRCEKYYRRTVDAVVYPPFRALVENVPQRSTEASYIIVSRLVGYKNIELAIRAVAKTHFSLRIIGDGPEKNSLQSLIKELGATDRISIISGVSEKELTQEYQRSSVALLLGEEDFGLAALEAMSLGIPVIINARSGAAECVTDDVTGILLPNLCVDAIVNALYSSQAKRWDSKQIKAHASKYNTHHFRQEFSAKLLQIWNEDQNTIVKGKHAVT